MLKILRLCFNFVKFISGTALIAWQLTSPALALAAYFSPRAFLLALAIIAFLAPLALLLFSQSGALRLLQGQLPRSFGLRNSYELAAAQTGAHPRSRPMLMTFPDPVPNVFVMRSLGRSGLVLLSEGFLSLLDESELEFVLSSAIERLPSIPLVLQSACIFALMMIEKAQLVAGHKIEGKRALRWLILFPWRQFYLSLAQAAIEEEVTRRVGEKFVRGASKLTRAERLYGQEAVLPGLVYLGIRR